MATPRGVWILLGWFLLCATTHAQRTTVTTPCDPRLVPPASDPLAYARRDDRCEGLYVLEVAGTGGLSVAGFTTASRPFTIRKGQPVRLEWPAPDGGAVTLRAVSLRSKLFYRMDSSRPAGGTRFDWPSDVLTQLKLTGGEIGLVAWTQGTVANRPEEIYVPLHVTGTEPAPGPGGEYLVTVVPGAPLNELFVSLSAVDASGKATNELLVDRPLRRGPYPAEYPIPVRLPKLTASGLYRLELNAVLKQGAPLPRSLYFRHTAR